MTTLDLIKHTAAVHINSSLTLNQRRIANLLLWNAYNEILEDKVHSIKLEKITQELGWSNESEVTNLLKSDLRILNTFQFEWNILNKDKKNVWGATTLLADVRIEKGYAFYTYSKTLREMLFNPNIYARLNLIIQKNFKNKHALVLWEYLLESLSSSQVNQIKTDFITIDNLRKLLGVLNNKSYDNYAIFKAQALTPALDEINTKSDITVELITKKEGRKIAYVAFSTERKIPIELGKNINYRTEQKSVYLQKEVNLVDCLENNNHIEIDNWLLENYKSVQISYEKLQADVETYGTDRVKKAIKLVNINVSKGKNIKSKPAYYFSALKENWEEQECKTNLDLEKDSGTFQLWNDELLSKEDGVALLLKKRLLEVYGIAVFNTWFRNIQVIEKNGNEIHIICKSDFIANRIISHYEYKITDLLSEIVSQCSCLEIYSE